MEKKSLVFIAIDVKDEDTKKCSVNCVYVYDNHEFLTYECGLFPNNSLLSESSYSSNSYFEKDLNRCQDCINMFGL